MISGRTVGLLLDFRLSTVPRRIAERVLRRINFALVRVESHKRGFIHWNISAVRRNSIFPRLSKLAAAVWRQLSRTRYDDTRERAPYHPSVPSFHFPSTTRSCSFVFSFIGSLRRFKASFTPGTRANVSASGRLETSRVERSVGISSRDDHRDLFSSLFVSQSMILFVALRR